MKFRNVEFKARVSNTESYEAKLQTLQPDYSGLDHQLDTYFNVPHGRLKLREGTIENALIQYQRENRADAKRSDVILYAHQPDTALKEILTLQFGVKTVVDKKRKIYFMENVKFHFDEVNGLGSFLEVEAIDAHNQFSLEELKAQCDYYFTFFGLEEKDLIAKSYSDLLEEKTADTQ